MKPTVNIPYVELQRMATQGSPMLLRSVGRLVGLGGSEIDQLKADGIPKWALVVVGIGAGFVAGAWAYEKWPRPMSKVIGK